MVSLSGHSVFFFLVFNLGLLGDFLNILILFFDYMTCSYNKCFNLLRLLSLTPVNSGSPSVDFSSRCKSCFFFSCMTISIEFGFLILATFVFLRKLMGIVLEYTAIT